jgi:hypothetical protein
MFFRADTESYVKMIIKYYDRIHVVGAALTGGISKRGHTEKVYFWIEVTMSHTNSLF